MLADGHLLLCSEHFASLLRKERLHTQRQAERRAKLLEASLGQGCLKNFILWKLPGPEAGERAGLAAEEAGDGRGRNAECLSMEAGTNLAVRPNVKLKKKRIASQL